jgi:hypothetical protein
MLNRIYLLSPAHCGGKRAAMLMRPAADFDLARRLRAQGVALGELFAFMSGLYFRGKLAYVNAFAPLPGGAWVITPNRGLLPPDTLFSLADLQAMATTSIQADDPAYREPLLAHARLLAARLGPAGEAVLLGSIATDKYVAPLQEAFGARLMFPAEFVGRGDMSRGGLMLRCAQAGQRLTYRPLAGAERHGKRPPRLEPRD